MLEEYIKTPNERYIKSKKIACLMMELDSDCGFGIWGVSVLSSRMTVMAGAVLHRCRPPGFFMRVLGAPSWDDDDDVDDEDCESWDWGTLKDEEQS